MAQQQDPVCKRSPYEFGRVTGRRDMMAFVPLAVAGAVAMAEPKQAQKALMWGAGVSFVAAIAGVAWNDRARLKYRDCSILHKAAVQGVGNVPLPVNYNQYLPPQW